MCMCFLLANFLREKFFPEGSFLVYIPITEILPFKNLLPPSARILCSKEMNWCQYKCLNYFTRGINIGGKFFGKDVLGREGRMRTNGALAVAARMRSRNTPRRSLSFLIDPVTQYTWPHSAASLIPSSTAPFRSYPAPPVPLLPPFSISGKSRFSHLLLPLLLLALFIWAQHRRCRYRVVSSIYLYAVSPLPSPSLSTIYRRLVRLIANTCAPRTSFSSPFSCLFLLVLTFFLP